MRDRPPWLVGIRRGLGEPVIGAGFLCADGTVLTCAHVIDPAMPDAAPENTVYLEFIFAGPHESVAAQVIGWHPGRGIVGDVAVLRPASVPGGAAPAPLASTLTGVAGDHAHVYGFPTSGDGVRPATVLMEGRAETEWLAMRSETDLGSAVTLGFSGAPLWDIERTAVIGMVVSRVRPGSKAPDPRMAFAIAADELAGYWPPLAEGLRHHLSAPEREALENRLAISLRDGHVPRVRDVDMHDIGVFRSRYVVEGQEPPAYVRRTLDEPLSQALASKRFVVLVGDSKAGKSRTLIEALRQDLGEARLVVPATPADLTPLSRMRLGPVPVVVWLEELDRWLVTPSGLDLKILDRFAAASPPTLVVATMTGANYDRVTAAGDFNRTAQTVLGRATTLWLATRLDDAERTEAAAAYPGEDFTERSIGAQLISAQVLEARFRAAAAADPVAYAAARAAVDWQRAGIDRAAPLSALRAIMDDLLAEQQRPATDDASFAAALAWATAEVNGSPALVERSGPDAVRAFAYLVDQLDREGSRDAAPVAAVVWPHVMREARAEELVKVATTAYSRNLPELGEQGLRAACASSDEHTRAWGALLLGMVLADDEPAEATQLLEQAHASDQPEVVGLAKVFLALLLLKAGDLVRAQTLLEQALAADDPDVSPLAGSRLGNLLVNQGEYGRALLTHKPADLPMQGEAGQQLGAVAELVWQHQALPLAQTSLGALLLDRGELRRARTLLERALESGADDVTPLTQSSYGLLLMLEGEFEQAEQMLEAAIASPVPAASLSATVSLAVLRGQQGDADTAAEMLAQVAHSGDVEQGPRAADLLGDLLLSRDDLSGAKEAYALAVGYSHPVWSPVAQTDLAVIAQREEDWDEAKRLLVAAAGQAGDSVHTLRATDLLGDLLARQGDTAGARAAYERVAASGDRDWAPIAQIDLAQLAYREGDVAEAMHYLRLAAASDSPAHALRATDFIGDLLMIQGDIEGARERYEYVIASEHPEWAPIARFDLGVLAVADEDLDLAAEQFQRVVAEGNRDYAAAARLQLGQVHYERGDQEQARALFLEAAESEVPDAVQQARFALTTVALEHGDLSQAAQWLELLRGGDADADAVALLAVVRTRMARLDPPPAELSGLGGPLGTDALVEAAEYLFSLNGIDYAAELAEQAAAVSPGPAAWALLGRVRLAQRDLEHALALLSDALQQCEPPLEWQVRLDLGRTLSRLERDDQARHVLRPLAESGDLVHGPAAMLLLGQLAELGGELPVARYWLRQAAELGDDEVADEAQEVLDGLIPGPESPPRDSPDLPGTGSATPAADSAPPLPDPVPPATAEPLPAQVAVLLGELAAAEGALDEAQAWWAQAAAGSDGQARLRARLGAAAVLVEQGAIEEAGPQLIELLRAGGPVAAAAARLLDDIELARAGANLRWRAT
ncbi:serine protease [Catellatospora sp. TT07R-123]|uniref:serine protease n=1 Tax=Catellatospora sp. TT07R-123 TaxID=2733863 RepID=UPI001BB41ADC|nr:serine protease [Catellatospora sp. TT07R-123]